MKDRADDDMPWTEQQWEDFMMHADMRAARYGELMETLLDHPERDEIIDKEIGWHRKRDEVDLQWLAELQEAEQSEDEGQFTCDNPDENQPPADKEDKGLSQSEKIDRMMEREDRDVRKIPAYAMCEEASLLIDEVIKPLMEGMKEEDDDLAQAFIQIKIAAAKVRSGHGMGYEDEILGGNVVNCKRALAATVECTTALNALASRQSITATQVFPLLEAVGKAHEAIEQRIADLRSRMWWQKR